MLNPELDRTPTWHFIEIYMEYHRQIPTIMILVSRTSGDYDVSYAADTSNIQFTASTYEEAHLWLLEDEFVRVSERITPDDIK